MKNKKPLIENEIKPDKKLLDGDIKHSISVIFKREVQKDGSIVWAIKIQPQTISDQENEVKNPTTKDLYDLIEYQGKQMSDFKLDMLKFKDDMLEFKSDINKKLDNHIVEFKSLKSDMLEFKDDMLEFKDDMLEFKDDMLSLPTISEELKNK